VYRVLLFLHVSGAVAFLLFHGATASVMFAMKREHDPERLQALLTLRDRAEDWWRWPLMLNLATGIAMGFMGRWWGQGWIWVSIGVFLAMSFAMSGIGRLNIDRVWHAIDPLGHASPVKSEARNPDPASQEELKVLLERGRPMLLTVIGMVGLAIILWMMIFKPL
jgi:hypothetical protein